MHQSSGISPALLPWRENGERDYFEACDRCEHLVVLSGDLHRAISKSLRCDKRQGGNRGRCLTNPFPDLGLQVGDRLVAGHALRDPADFEGLCRFPCPVLFWRKCDETLARNRNPLFGGALGISPAQSMTVDTMHCLYLGIFDAWSKVAIWTLIQEGAFCEQPNQEETFQAAVVVIHHELKQFFRRKAAAGESLTRVTFRQKTLGDVNDKKLRTKAAETWGVMLYLVETCEARFRRLGQHGVCLWNAGQALVVMMRTLSSAGPVLAPVEIQRAFDHWCRFLSLTENLPGVLIPKRHLATHMLRKASFFGNPTRYATWRD